MFVVVLQERPGIGLSSPKPDATLMGHARDIDELAENLNLKEYRVIVSLQLPHYDNPYSLLLRAHREVAHQHSLALRSHQRSLRLFVSL
jgi:hypothetical protein